MNFNFPRTIFTNSNSISQQIRHITSESMEATEAVRTPDIEHTAMEIMDCLHSCETALRILDEKHGVGLSSIRAEVEHKNRIRGYYGN